MEFRCPSDPVEAPLSAYKRYSTQAETRAASPSAGYNTKASSVEFLSTTLNLNTGGKRWIKCAFCRWYGRSNSISVSGLSPSSKIKLSETPDSLSISCGSVTYIGKPRFRTQKRSLSTHYGVRLQRQEKGPFPHNLAHRRDRAHPCRSFSVT